MSPDLAVRMDRTLARARAATGVSLAFGGPVTGSGSVLLDRFDGRTVGALPGVSLDPREGLGGRAVALRRPIAVNDYFDTSTITHRYDGIIRAEGFRSLVAMPVILGRRPVGVIYGAFRGDDLVGGRIQQVFAEEARSLEQELAVAAARGDSAATPTATENARLREQMRAVYTELRVLARSVSSPGVRESLTRAADQLIDAQTADVRAVPIPVALTNREVDVLALAGSGLSNRQIADVLGLTLHTVKGYVKSAMRKLSAHTRLEAVVRARSGGVIA